MGLLVKIELKDKSEENIQLHNSKLEKLDIENGFCPMEEVINTINDINNNPDSPQAHLKPITAEELMKGFFWYQVGAMWFDIGFGRTSQEDVEKYFQYIKENKESINKISNVDSIVERYLLDEETKEILLSFDEEIKEPEKLPIEEQYNPKLESGHILCDSTGLKPIWLIFGNVETPTLLKTRIYVNEIYNNIYRDKEGIAFILIPQLKITNNPQDQIDKANEIYEKLIQLGVREEFYYIMGMVYSLEFTITIDQYAKILKETFTQNELISKLKFVVEYLKSCGHILSMYESNGYYYRSYKRGFLPNGNHTSTLNAKLKILSGIVNAIEDKTMILNYFKCATTRINFTIDDFQGTK